MNTLGWLPSKAALYDWVSLHVLCAALVLMLVGTPLRSVLRMGPKALGAMMLGVGTMTLATWISFLLIGRFLPEEGWKAGGALLATWTGGSANMLAVKEILRLSDAGFAPLIIVDTVLSYSWMAVLIFGAAYQKFFDAAGKSEFEEGLEEKAAAPRDEGGKRPPWKDRILSSAVVLGAGFLFGEMMIRGGKLVGSLFSILTASGWAILLSTTLALFFASTPLKRLEEKGASSYGQLALYFVLITIGAKTNLSAAREAPLYILFGIGVLTIHGVLLLYLGRLLKMPLFLLATASQANVGGAISAPIVAGVYRPGMAHFGVLMAIVGVVLGTYVGAFGGYACRLLGVWMQ